MSELKTGNLVSGNRGDRFPEYFCSFAPTTSYNQRDVVRLSSSFPAIAIAAPQAKLNGAPLSGPL